MDPILRSDVFLPLIRSNDKSLRELILQNAHVTQSTLDLIGDALRTNKHLKVLDLSHNDLHDDDVAYFIDALQGNQGLETLRLSGNPDLSDVTIDQLTETLMKRNDSIRLVEVDGTGITPSKAEAFAVLSAMNKYPAQLKRQAFRAYCNDPSLFTIELTYDKSDPKVFNEESMRLLAQTLVPSRNTTVRTLKLDYCCRGEKCVKELAPLIASNHHIVRLSLQHNYLGDEAADILCDAIEQAGDKCSLEDLDLCDNEITNAGLERLIDMLETNTSLRSIALLNNHPNNSPELLTLLRQGTALNCEPSSMRAALAKIDAGLPKNMSPEAEKECYLRQERGEMLDERGILDLRGNEEDVHKGPSRGYFTNLGAQSIARALQTNITIHTIRFDNNHIGPNGAKALAELLEYNPTIVRLNLSNNPITDEGARHIITALRRNDALVSLNLTDCGVSEKLLAEAAAACHLNAQPEPIKELLKMPQGTAPEVLNLRRRTTQVRGKWRSLYPESVQYILTILNNQRHVTELDVSDNDTLGDEGVIQLLEWLRDPRCRLVRLDISKTDISDDSLTAITEALRACYTIHTIAVAGNLQITTRPRQLMEEVLSLNDYMPEVKDMIPLLQGNTAGIDRVIFNRQDKETYKKAKMPVPAPLGDDTVRLLFSALVRNTHVHTVSLRNQQVSNRGLGYITECLEVNTSITSLDLSDNMIGPDGISDFAPLLERNTSLRTLCLSGNPLMEEGGARLQVAMQTANRSVTRIELLNTRMLEATQRKIECLAMYNTQATDFRSAVLERIGVITCLRYDGHPFSSNNAGSVMDDCCVDALAMALRAHPHKLRAIQIQNNAVTDAGLLRLLQIIDENPSIVALDMHNNPLTDAVVTPIVDFLQEHPHVRTFGVGPESAPDENSRRKKKRPETQEEQDKHMAIVAAFDGVSTTSSISPTNLRRIATAVALNNTPSVFLAAYRKLEKALIRHETLKAQLEDAVKHDKKRNMRNELQQQVVDTVVDVVDVSRCEVTGRELRLLMELLLEHGSPLTTTLRGLGLCSNPGLDDAAVEMMVNDFLLPHCRDTLQILQLDNCDGVTGRCVGSVLTPYAESSNVLVSVSLENTAADHRMRAHQRCLLKEQKRLAEELEAEGDSTENQVAVTADKTKEDNAVAAETEDGDAALARQWAALQEALSKNRARLVAIGADELFRGGVAGMAGTGARGASRDGPSAGSLFSRRLKGSVAAARRDSREMAFETSAEVLRREEDAILTDAVQQPALTEGVRDLCRKGLLNAYGPTQR